MRTTDLKYAIRVGQIKVGARLKKSTGYILYPTGLVVEWDDTFPKELKRQHLAIVYFLAVDGEIKKIGQSSGTNGITGCLGFYLNAGTDDPSQTRFAINYLIREELAKGRQVEVYMQYETPLTHTTKGIFSEVQALVPISAKGMEDACKADYKAVHDGALPVWNFQEAGLPLPLHIDKAYADYKQRRNEGRAASVGKPLHGT